MARLPLCLAAAFLLGSISTPLAQENPIEVPFETERNLIFLAV